MGLINSLLDKVPGLEGNKLVDIVGGIADGVVDGALVLAGPPGWAALGAKTVAYAAVDPNVGIGQALTEGAKSAALGVVGGAVLGGAAKAVAGQSGTLAKAVTGANNANLKAVAAVGTKVAGKTNQLLARSPIGTQWLNASAHPNVLRVNSAINSGAARLTSVADDLTAAAVVKGTALKGTAATKAAAAKAAAAKATTLPTATQVATAAGKGSVGVVQSMRAGVGQATEIAKAFGQGVQSAAKTTT